MSRELFLAGYLGVLAAAVAVEAYARAGRRVATLSAALDRAVHSRGGRAWLVAIWLWAGWHVFVRANW